MLKRALVASVPCLLILSGCGVAGTDFNPGVAARVGDETVTTDEVDEMSARFCDAVEKQLADAGQSVPLAGLKSAVTQQLALMSATEQVAAPYDLTPGQDYRTALDEINKAADASGYTGEAREAYVEIQATQPRYNDLLTQVGAVLLEREGEDDPTIDFQLARGYDALTEFVLSEGMTFDPRYGLTVDEEGLPAPANTDISLAVGDTAKAGAALASSEDPDPAYIASLPATATCG